MAEVSLNSTSAINGYIRLFASEDRTASQGAVYVDAKHFQDRDSDIYKQAAALEPNLRFPDDALELALAIQYTGAVKSRPVKATEFLPEGHASDVKLATATYSRLQAIKFLYPQDSERIGRYELMIRTLKQRNNVAQTEIDTGIRSLISDAVDEEFNKISFLLKNKSTSHNAILTRNPQNGQYTLSYGGAYTNNETRVITANSLKALSSEMRNGKYKTDFDETGINTVETQDVLMPAVKLNPSEQGNVKDILTAFYLNPNQTTYDYVRKVASIYHRQTGARYANRETYLHVSFAYGNILSQLSGALSEKTARDVLNNANNNSDLPPNITVEKLYEQLVAAQR
jgi:hypothetical protein